jgi:2-hydroxy-3-keto-5-methylthiopentenyl-1-phosphate phosphatase
MSWFNRKGYATSSSCSDGSGPEKKRTSREASRKINMNDINQKQTELYQSIVFCDFDGTITEQETLARVFSKFAPETWQPIKEDLTSGKITVREAVTTSINSIDSSHYHDILSYTLKFSIRPGFNALLDFLDSRNVPMVVLSGGIRGMVEIRLGKLINRMHSVFAADVDTNGKYLRTKSAYEGKTELVDKVRIMNFFNTKEKIAIGDGITDFNMAQAADLVFARGGLARFMDENNIFYEPWFDFYDICDHLQAHFSKS